MDNGQSKISHHSFTRIVRERLPSENQYVEVRLGRGEEAGQSNIASFGNLLFLMFNWNLQAHAAWKNWNKMEDLTHNWSVSNFCWNVHTSLVYCNISEQTSISLELCNSNHNVEYTIIKYKAN